MSIRLIYFLLVHFLGLSTVLVGSCSAAVQQPAYIVTASPVAIAPATIDISDDGPDAPTMPVRKLFYRIYQNGKKPLLLVFLEALAGGLIAVFTPYVYSFVPMTIGTLLYRTRQKNDGWKNTAMFAGFVWLIFAAFGGLVSVLAGSTGLAELGHHWLFNLFFFRLLGGLGLSLVGAFDIKLPLRIVRVTQEMAQAHSVRGIFFMALSLPVVTFSSTMPLMGLVLVLAGKGGVFGPIVGMAGFALGLSAPFVYPRLINLMPVSALNYLKVLMGFVALLLAIKFFSNADVSQGWHILSREVFVGICMLFCFFTGIHMLGFVKLSNDHATSTNVYGQPYVSIVRLFVAIGAFMLFIYLLPGLWGAPLHGVSLLLPPQGQ